MPRPRGGAPPKARDGQSATNVGRPLAAGVGPHERILGSRSTAYELWTPLRTLVVPEVGLSRLQRLWGSKVDSAAHARFSAFISQAEAFYLSAEGMPAESRPLVAYYFALNLAKAFLTCADPPVTTGKVFHGLSDDFDRKSRYWFIHERTKVTTKGAFRDLARRTGLGYCYARNHSLAIQKLAPYLAETADVYEDSVGEPPRLVPLESVEVWSGGGHVWLRVEVDRGELRRRSLGPQSLPERAKLFGSRFKLVRSERPTASYESDPLAYGGRQILTKADELRERFDHALIHSNRGIAGARHLVVISDKTELLSQEAVTFAVFHHLSSMVRYRPEQVAKLSAQKWFFLFSTWGPRAMENFLLSLTSRILREEVRIQ